MRFRTSKNDTNDLVLDASSVQTGFGNTQALVKIMRANNQRLFRIARGILRNDSEAEEVVQETFIKVFTSVNDLRDETKLDAWMAKIAVNLSRDRLRQNTRANKVFSIKKDAEIIPINAVALRENDALTSPERLAAMGDIRRMIESEIDRLPNGFREVFVMREIEQLTIGETAELLSLVPATVKTRLHRAKALLRKGLEGRLNAESLSAFPFGGVRCTRSTNFVLKYLQDHAQKQK